MTEGYDEIDTGRKAWGAVALVVFGSTVITFATSLPAGAQVVAGSPGVSDGWVAAGSAFYICNGQPGVAEPSTCATVQWFEKTASSNGTTGILKVKTMTTTAGNVEVLECLLGAAGEAALTVMSGGTTALYAIPEATYEAACAFSVASSWIASVASNFVVPSQ